MFKNLGETSRWPKVKSTPFALLGSKPRPVGWTQRRQRIEDVGSVWPVAEDIQREPIDIGGMPAEWSMAPGSDASCVLLYFHGGGYCSGSILSHRRLVTEAGRAAKARTRAIEYRLAPEHPFPAALDDALSARKFLRKCGIAAEHIAVGGDSAGGGLTVALIERLRNMGDIDRRDPRVSPLYAELTGLPPTLIQIGACETLLDDSTRFAAAAGAANVAVTLEIWPDMIHAWPMWNSHLEPGRRALANAGDFIRRHL